MDNIFENFQAQFDEIEMDHDDISLDVTEHQQHPVTYALMSMVFEGGEAGNKFKKILRDQNGEINSVNIADIIEELGDVLFYLTLTAKILGCTLEDVIFVLNTKLEARYGGKSIQTMTNGIPRRVSLDK